MPSRSYPVKPWPNKAQTGEWCPSNLEHNVDFELNRRETPPKPPHCEPERSIPTERRDRRQIAPQGPPESASQPPEVRGLEKGGYALDFSPYRSTGVWLLNRPHPPSTADAITQNGIRMVPTSFPRGAMVSRFCPRSAGRVTHLRPGALTHPAPGRLRTLSTRRSPWARGLGSPRPDESGVDIQAIQRLSVLLAECLV
jgi:hypothetical protein